MASNGEYMINARSTAKYRSLLEAINADTLGTGRGMPGAGAAVAQGLVSGMSGAVSDVGAAARTMAAAVTSGIKEELQIASPSKKTKALAKDVGKGFIDGLTGSRDKIKSVSKDLATDVRTAFSGKKESGLLKMIDKQTKRLLDAATKRDKLAAKIAEAKKYASDVTTAARESAGLSNLGMQPEEVTAGGIKAGLGQKLAQIKQFTTYIGILAKKGLSKGLLRQILDMGPDAGYAYASALVGADKATFASINKTQNAVDKASTALGRSGADILYDSGKQAGKGFLKGLEGQQKDIEKLMMSIAKGMQKSIKKALGIKSPSTVMAQLGRYSTQGLARGLVDGVPVLDRALDVVTGRVAGAQPVLGRTAGAGGGGGIVYNVTVTVQEAMDPIADGRELQRVLVQLGRAQGATVKLNLGG
jgi:chorismate mutase